MPTPVFYSSSKPTFSTKKERATCQQRPRFGPKRYPPKSAPPLSRCFPSRLSSKPQQVSFKHPSENSLLNSHYYDERRDTPYFKQCFFIECQIGEGSFGVVYRVRSREDGRQYAVKKSHFPFRSAADRTKRLAEVQKHEQLPKHPNLVDFIQAWEENGYLYIQTELCHISLNDYSELHHEIPESQIWGFLVDLLTAVRHLHNHGLMHCDVKPDNIFITRDNLCKLGDFGLVHDVDWTVSDDVPEGDSKYLAPEVLQLNRYGPEADIFSVGITILEVACDLEVPKDGELWQMLRSGCLPYDLMQHRSGALQDVIELMVRPSFTQRPTAAQLLSMPCMRNVKRRRSCLVLYVQAKDYLLHWFWLLWFVTHALFTLLAKAFRPLKRMTPPSRRGSGGVGFDLYTPPDSVLHGGEFDDCLASRRPAPFFPNVTAPVPHQQPMRLNRALVFPDESFSDDDNVSELSSIYNSSGAANSPSGRSQVGTDDSYLADSLSHSPWNSTPAAPGRGKQCVQQQMPFTQQSKNVPLPFGDDHFDSPYSGSPRRHVRHAKACSKCTSSPNERSRRVLGEGAGAFFGQNPKNLADVFDATSSDDEE